MSQYPYAGLRPFQREETDIFFGREQHTDELLTCLSQQKFLAVIGVSGCGKSSLVKTGLIPALEAGFLSSAGTHWKVAEMRPSNQPFKNLSEALVNNKVLGENYATALLQNDFLKRGAFSLHELLAIQPLPNNAKLLIVCDQFEEIFRYYEQGSKSEAEAFVSLLLASSKPYTLPDNTISNDIYIVLTMRSDFLGDCALFSGLAEAINKGLYLTPRLNREQLRTAIEEPAFVFGGEVEPELVVKLLEDASNDSDQLPLLQHILMRLWFKAQHRNPIYLTLEDYQSSEIDGLKNALSHHADEILNSLSQEQQRIAELLFRSLSDRQTEKRDTRRPVKLSEVMELANVSIEDIAAIIKVFQQEGCNFLITDKQLIPDSIIDISHESLIRQWQTLQTWAEKEADSAETYRRLQDRAMEWQKQKAGLLQFPELEVFLQWYQTVKPNFVWAKRYGEQFELAEEYLKTSQLTENKVQQEKDKKRRRVIIGLICFSTIVSGLAGFSFVQYEKAEEQTKIAKNKEQEADKQRLLADQKTQDIKSLKNQTDQLVTLTISSLATQGQPAINKYLDDVENKGLRDIFIAVLAPLILETESMDEAERKYWFDILPRMTDNQVRRLSQILFTEKSKLISLEIKYRKEINELNSKHSNEYVDYTIKNINKQKPDSYLNAAEAIIDTNIDTNLDAAHKAESYLSSYKKLVTKPDVKMYYLYGKYFQKKSDKDNATSNYLQAYQQGDTIENMEEYLQFFRDNSDFKTALKIATTIKEANKINFNESKKSPIKYSVPLSWKNKNNVLPAELGKIFETKIVEFSIARSKDEFLDKIRLEYGKLISNEIIEKILKEFKVDTSNASKEKYLDSVARLLKIKRGAKDLSPLPDLDEALQLSETIKTADLSTYLNIQSEAVYFYYEQNNPGKATEIQNNLLSFYETSPQKKEINKSWISKVYHGFSFYQSRYKQHEQAIALAEKAIEYDAGNVDALTRLSIVLYQQKNYIKAAKVFEEALTKFPDNLSLLSNDLELSLVQNDNARFQQRLEVILPQLKPQDQLHTVLPFLIYLSEPKKGYQSMIDAIEKSDKTVEINWDFSDIEQSVIQRYDEKTQKIAHFFIDYFKNRDLATLKAKLADLENK